MLGRIAVVAVALTGAGCDAVFGTGTPTAPPDAAPLPSDWETLASGFTHTCGIRIDRTLWCWGRNEDGQLAQPTSIAEASTPLQIGERTD